MKKGFLLGMLMLTLPLFSQIAVKINDSVTYQEIVGFGWHGSMNVWWSNGPFYDNTYLNNVVDDLGMTMNRNNFYAYDMTQYNNKQKTYYAALKNKAAASNEPMFFIHTVWSPPIEWKANNKVCDNTCSSTCNAVKDLSSSCNSKTNYLLPQYYDDYANFCADYIKDKLTPETGVDLYAFSLQNESAFNEPYESCVYSPQQYTDLLKVAGPIFRTKCPKVKLFGPEDMGSASTTSTWTSVIFNDTTAVKYLDVLAVHGYTDGVNAATGDAAGWSSMYNIASSKKKQLWMTETSGFSSTWTGSPGAFDAAKALYMALKHGKISAWTWWQFGSSTMTSDKLYYVFKSYYRYIRPGALQIESSSADANVFVVAFKNSGNSTYSAVKPQLTILLINNSTSAKTVNVSGRGVPSNMKAYRTSSSENCAALADATTSSVSLPSQSVTTLVYQSTNKAPLIDQPKDIIVVKNKGNITVNLTNVTAGTGETQTLNVTAIADNKTIVPGAITVTGSSPNYSLSFAIASNVTGSCNIKVFVKDNGSTDALNTTMVKFNVKVIPLVNHAPTIAQLPDITCGINNSSKKHYIGLSGITDGDDNTQTIIKPVLSFSDNNIVRLPYVNYTSPGNSGTIEFYPNALGTTQVTLKIQDNGGTDLSGVDVKIITFNITVVSNAPYLATGEMSDEVLEVFPNPAIDIVNIKIPDKNITSVMIIDVAGKIVMEKAVTSNQMQVDVSELTNGIYFIIAKGGETFSKSKLSISR